MPALQPSCFNLANLKSSFEEQPVISRFVQSYRVMCCVYAWGGGRGKRGAAQCLYMVFVRKPSFYDLAGVCVTTGPQKAPQSQNNVSQIHFCFFVHIYVFSSSSAQRKHDCFMLMCCKLRADVRYRLFDVSPICLGVSNSLGFVEFLLWTQLSPLSVTISPSCLEIIMTSLHIPLIRNAC